MLKKTLAALLVLAGLTSATEITFTADPFEIDEDDEYFGAFLPNTGCRAMAEFMNAEEPYYGDVMVIDLCKNMRQPYVPGKSKSCSIWYSIWDATEDEWDEFVGTDQGAVFLGEAIPTITDYSQLPNASIYSSYDGVIHMGGWFGYPHVAYAYSRYQCVNDKYTWYGFGGDDDHSFYSAMYFLDQEKQRFGQVMQPTFYVNERSIPTSSVVPTFFVNGHDCEDNILKTGFYLQTLTDPTYEGQWNDPSVISPQTFGNMGFSSVTGDQYGKLHIFWESSINTGYANFKWQSTFAVIVQNELYYTNYYNGLPSQITQLTDNYATSGGEYFVGVNLISSDVDPSGNVWALYELITTAGDFS
ncbi:MAG TPA: hypothetical protein VM054_01470, partial [bacterium]|nr:hypothetical protein [bacterium]